MEIKIQTKHSEKTKLKKELKHTQYTEKKIDLIIFNTVFRQLNIALKSKFKVTEKCHHKTLTNLGKQQGSQANKSITTYIKKYSSKPFILSADNGRMQCTVKWIRSIYSL